MLLESIAATALEKAVGLATKYLDEAKKEIAKTKKYNVASCIRFLEAARIAL